MERATKWMIPKTGKKGRRHEGAPSVDLPPLPFTSIHNSNTLIPAAVRSKVWGQRPFAYFLLTFTLYWWKYINECSRYSESLLTGRSGDRIPIGARFSSSALAGPRSHPVSCTSGTGFLSRG
jgi:hypothetical protein